MKSVSITSSQWSVIKDHLTKSHPRSVMLVREKMKRVLGFTPRTQYDPKTYKRMIHLDFFSEQHKTMFLLKYGDMIKKNE